jgi:ABC-type uncharacterized transport system fused permease/ATPase subunit
MSVVSKYLGEVGVKELPHSKGVSILWSVCTLSSTTSALILFNLYRKSKKIRKSTKKALEAHQQLQLQKSAEACGKKRANLNRKFFTQLLRILRILVPKWNCPEVGLMGLTTITLIIRSLCDLWTIYLGTLLESAIISGESQSFFQHLKKFAMTMPLMSVTNSVLKYATRQLEIRFRARLTKHLMQKYMHKLTFYKLNQKIRNVDQLITTDVEKFAQTAASLYGQLSKPMLDIIIYVYGISR